MVLQALWIVYIGLSARHWQVVQVRERGVISEDRGVSQGFRVSQ